MKSPADMTAGEINKALDRLEALSSTINQALIDTGRGHETPTVTRHKTDPLSLKWNACQEDLHVLRQEIALRYGPGAPHRLPHGRGFGPRKGRY